MHVQNSLQPSFEASTMIIMRF